MIIKQREADAFCDKHYIIAGGGEQGEWLRMEWRADTPREQRDSLLIDVKQ